MLMSRMASSVSDHQEGPAIQCHQESRSQDLENHGASDYFASYNNLDVHQLMLKDRPRTLAYRNFFENHRDLVKDKVVLDVGAGTGILSLFAAIAGARKVYAVEASDVAALCREVVEDNGLTEIIEVIHSAVEDIHLDTKVDVIVSEWMGFYLLHESMLDSVIVARDKFLAPGGIMAPSHASMYFAPVDMSDHFTARAEEWSNVYGFDFSPIASALNMQEVRTPLVQQLPPDWLRSQPQKLLNIDLSTVTQEDIRRFSASLQFHVSQETMIHGFACWFDTLFSGSGIDDGESKNCDGTGASQDCPQTLGVDERGDNMKVADATSSGKTGSTGTSSPSAGGRSSTGLISLRTGPQDPATHWKQTVIFLPQTIMVGPDMDVCCRVTMAQDSNSKRHYNITLGLIEDLHSEETDDNDEEEEDDEEIDESARNQLISALVARYDAEHEELEDEAQQVELKAEVEAAKQLDEAIEREGWPMDTSSSGTATADADSSTGDQAQV